MCITTMRDMHVHAGLVPKPGPPSPKAQPAAAQQQHSHPAAIALPARADAQPSAFVAVPAASINTSRSTHLRSAIAPPARASAQPPASLVIPAAINAGRSTHLRPAIGLPVQPPALVVLPAAAIHASRSTQLQPAVSVMYVGSVPHRAIAPAATTARTAARAASSNPNLVISFETDRQQPSAAALAPGSSPQQPIIIEASESNGRQQQQQPATPRASTNLLAHSGSPGSFGADVPSSQPHLPEDPALARSQLPGPLNVRVQVSAPSVDESGPVLPEVPSAQVQSQQTSPQRPANELPIVMPSPDTALARRRSLPSVSGLRDAARDRPNERPQRRQSAPGSRDSPAPAPGNSSPPALGDSRAVAIDFTDEPDE